MIKVGPVIKVAKSFEANEDLLALIDGSVYDDSEIALIVIDGDPVSLTMENFLNNFLLNQVAKISILQQWTNLVTKLPLKSN